MHTKDRNWMEILYAEEYQPGRKVVNFFGVMVLGLFWTLSSVIALGQIHRYVEEKSCYFSTLGLK